MKHSRLPALVAACVSWGLLLVMAAPSLAAGGLRVAPPSRSGDALRRDDLARAQRLRLERRQQFPDVLTRPGRQQMAGFPASDTIRVALVRIDFLTDRGAEASTGDGHFDLSGPNASDPPVDPPPHNRAFFESHAEALRRYYDAQSYGDVAVVADVWPREQNGAYSLGDMADFGPWVFGPDLYAAAVQLFRAMSFAADSQSLNRGDRIPWDSYDRIDFIHAGSDHQSDLASDSPEDIPTFTIGVIGDDAVIFPDSANRPITQASILPETISQDGSYGVLNGILAHENGHNCFGLPDVADVETGSTVVGLWSLMDAGPSVGAILTLPDQSQLFATGLLPPSIDPFNRRFIAPAIVPQDIAVGDTIWLPEIEGGSHIRRVVLNDDEYLLIENRFLDPNALIELDTDPTTHVVLGPRYPGPLSYDALLPGGGVLIWQVDEFVIRRDFALNMDPSRRGLELIEADGLDDLGDPISPFMLGSPTDPWYVGNNTELGSATTPALVTHAGNDPHLTIGVLDPIQFEMRVSVVAEPATAVLNPWIGGDVSPGFSLTLTGANPAGRSPVGIAYSVAHESRVRITVVDLQGRRVAVVADEVAKPGARTIAWQGASDLAAGLYFVVAQAGSQRISRRLIIAP